ncbi:hypothetical protein B0T11DRAFT_285358 [Plectosphaerella cucumerina]|uniref:Uncharacterized protein n=1 Tax=Plectosphaerella cucumerina TaxID=40658 RepID=A0A8K0TE45_9PEZI|nr:hypothetical protein B0T11DRAFT_285358 [Plectosphaerella cucumerina]
MQCLDRAFPLRVTRERADIRPRLMPTAPQQPQRRRKARQGKARTAQGRQSRQAMRTAKEGKERGCHRNLAVHRSRCHCYAGCTPFAHPLPPVLYCCLLFVCNLPTGFLFGRMTGSAAACPSASSPPSPSPLSNPLNQATAPAPHSSRPRASLLHIDIACSTRAAYHSPPSPTPSPPRP